MPEGFGYVLAAYGATLATLVLWFWLIAARYRRVRAMERTEDASVAPR